MSVTDLNARSYAAANVTYTPRCGRVFHCGLELDATTCSNAKRNAARGSQVGRGPFQHRSHSTNTFVAYAPRAQTAQALLAVRSALAARARLAPDLTRAHYRSSQPPILSLTRCSTAELAESCCSGCYYTGADGFGAPKAAHSRRIVICVRASLIDRSSRLLTAPAARERSTAGVIGAAKLLSRTYAPQSGLGDCRRHWLACDGTPTPVRRCRAIDLG